VNSFSDITLLAGNANPALAREVSDLLDIKLCDARIQKFADGEISVRINESIRGKDVFLIQYGTYPTNDNVMELLIILDALKRASAGRINVVSPYFAYSRQDRKDKPRVPITARLLADLITVAGGERLLTIDLHSDQTMGFFNIPVDRLQAMPIIAEYILSHDFDMDKLVVVAPDVGSVKRSRALAEYIDVPLAIVDKRRPADNVAEVMSVIGDVKGKDVIMIDDIVDTAGTLVSGAEALKELGANHIFSACTHALLSGPAIDRISSSEIDKLVITNTIPLPPEKQLPKIEVISIAPLLSKAISRIHGGMSVSVLFDKKR